MSKNDTKLDHLTTVVESPPEDADDGQTFFKQFGIEVGKVQVTEESGRERWMWKAKTDRFDVVSGTIFDAVMGVIEKETGGEL